MLEIVRIIDNSNIIEIRFNGDITIDELEEVRKKVHEIYDKHGLMHALLDMRDTKLDMSTLEIHNFAKTMSRPIGARIALLVNTLNTDTGFFHAVASNSGFPMNLFHKYSDALSYLTK